MKGLRALLESFLTPKIYDNGFLFLIIFYLFTHLKLSFQSFITHVLRFSHGNELVLLQKLEESVLGPFYMFENENLVTLEN